MDPLFGYLQILIKSGNLQYISLKDVPNPIWNVTIMISLGYIHVSFHTGTYCSYVEGYCQISQGYWATMISYFVNVIILRYSIWSVQAASVFTLNMHASILIGGPWKVIFSDYLNGGRRWIFFPTPHPHSFSL